ncbi:DHX58 helicase, partial [Glareola pratincola]|nr:DHX58 helicase [Glareola pratincola]
QICANLDAEKITSAQEELQQLQRHVPQPRKQYDLCQERAQDPFGEQLKMMMRRIQQYMEVPGLPQDFGTQVYEQRIVELEKTAAETFCRKTRVCALHLRKYNDALLVNDTVRMIDAFQCLQQFYTAERDTKDPTEQFLTATFEGNVGTWGRLNWTHYSRCGLTRAEQRGRRTSLDLLTTALLMQGSPLGLSPAPGRASLQGAAGCGERIHPHRVSRTGLGGVSTMSLLCWPQRLSLPLQARGRARAENSVYSVLAKANSREVSRELLNEDLVELMERAIRAVQAMPEQEYRLKVRELQRVAVASWLMKEARISERRQLHDPDDVRLYCVNCNVAVCRGSDLRTVEGMHHVNVNPNFGLYYRVSSGKLQFQRTFKDWEPGCRIACGECSQDWGMEMIYRHVKLPILCIKNFVVETPAEKRRYKKWSAVTFPVKEFDYLEYCS